MPLARAPCVMTWKPEENALALASRAAARPARRDEDLAPGRDGAVSRCSSLACECETGTSNRTMDTLVGQSRPPRSESQRNSRESRRSRSRRRLESSSTWATRASCRRETDRRQRTDQSAREVPVTVGTILGDRYRIDSVLGFGGMGVVYRARDLKLDQRDRAQAHPPRSRVARAARNAAARDHPLAARSRTRTSAASTTSWRSSGEEFVSMEFLPGRTLKDIEDDEKTLPLGRGLAIAKGICGGLAAAHRIGVLHRDLKPENVIVGEDGEPHLMDFGIAIESALFRGEKGDTVPGTPQFLAPELLQGEHAEPSGPTSTRWASFSTRCSRAASPSTTTTRRARAPRDRGEAAEGRDAAARSAARAPRHPRARDRQGPRVALSPTRRRSPTRSPPSRARSSTACSPRCRSRAPRWSS